MRTSVNRIRRDAEIAASFALPRVSPHRFVVRIPKSRGAPRRVVSSRLSFAPPFSRLRDTATFSASLTASLSLSCSLCFSLAHSFSLSLSRSLYLFLSSSRSLSTSSGPAVASGPHIFFHCTHQSLLHRSRGSPTATMTATMTTTSDSSRCALREPVHTFLR